VLFYSQADESAFFHFAQSIKAVTRIEGSGDSILLRVSSRPSRESLRALRALFQRYRISNKAQLRNIAGATRQPK
jgi:hypothetical protein